MLTDRKNGIWKKVILSSLEDAIKTLDGLEKNNWITRGQSIEYNTLIPKIDRVPRNRLSREEKIHLERESITKFRSNVKFCASKKEEESIQSDIGALMVLQHYGVPTRLLDWSMSPYIATCFATSHNIDQDGELWGFDHPKYEIIGPEQWKEFTETLDNGKFNPNMPLAFNPDYKNNWFVCQFNYVGFPRYDSQNGCFTFTPQFGCDHAYAIRNLLQNESYYCRFIIKAHLKRAINEYLLSEYKLSREMLFPDSAGAAEILNENLFPSK